MDAKGEWRSEGEWLDALNVSAAHNDYTHTEFEAPAEPGTIFEQQAFELRVAADHHWNSDWRGTLGAQHVDIDFEAIGDEAFVPASVTRRSSVFAFEERHFDRWTLELGARAEQQRIEPRSDLQEYDRTAVNASAGFVFSLTDERVVAVNLTRTERHPQSAELYAEGPHLAAGRVEIGDAELDKETSITADVSLRATGDIEWTLSAFYNDYTDYIFASPTGEFAPGESSDDGLPIYAYRQGGAKLYGYEAEITFPLLASDYVRGKLDAGDNLPQMPPLRFGVGLHYEKHAWHAGIEVFRHFEQDKVVAYELPTDAYTLVDIDVSYRWTRGAKAVLLFVRGTNLLDEDARLATSPLKDIAPLPGRAVRVGIRAQI